MRLWDLEALGMIAAGVFTLNIVCTAIVKSAVVLVRSWRAEASRSTLGRHLGVDPRFRRIPGTE
jgi:hypothetical protein